MPSLESVAERRIEQSTKIYDRTGAVLLYDLHQDVKRTIVDFDKISPYIKQATVAIEDARFYEHYGVEPTAIVRAVLKNILIILNLRDGYVQGGSTITQQVVKNSLLYSDKKISRKLKEWVLALRLERELTKDEILEIYLNESPYGGNRYGVEEASQAYFGKAASDVSVAQAAYLAALPQAPTFFSPYGNNKERLEARKNQVLERMLEHGYISPEVKEQAQAEVVEFLPVKDTGIKAPHFVFYVIEELEEMYGKARLDEGGLKVVTTLDWELQAKGEEIVERYARENEKTFNAENAALVAIDPKTGDVVTMVGSRDYFDPEIDGAFNVALARRQPGSSFKPFAYAAALLKGYTSETVVFDVPTQFSTACPPDNLTSEGDCYSPKNYDNTYRGPMSFRDALAQSVNVPAVKVVYLAGLNNALLLAERMGITTLGDARRYGLTLVLGGGEVTLLQMTEAYATFAHKGVRYPHRTILRVEDRNGIAIDEPVSEPIEALDASVAVTITDMLADNAARAPAFGPQSYLYFADRPVAAKTGTTNEYKDAWIMGYMPQLAVGAWAGNNDASPMEKKVAGFIIAPLWNEFMLEAFKKYPEIEPFERPDPIPTDIKPILRGAWQGGEVVYIDSISGKRATERTPPEARVPLYHGGVHSILHWVSKDDPRGPVPTNPAQDPQYNLWEYAVQQWLTANPSNQEPGAIPDEDDDVHTDDASPEVVIENIESGDSFGASDTVRITLDIDRKDFPIERVDYFVNGELIGSSKKRPYSFSFIPQEENLTEGEHTITVVAIDEAFNRGEATVEIAVQ
jgi:1A family penicillin-binding protein